MGQDNFENEVLQRLARIEAHQENTSKQCAPCQAKIDSLGIQVARVEASAKSAHHRLDAMHTDRSELKKDLTDAIKEQIIGIYRTVTIVGGVISLFVSLVMWLVTGHWGH